ISSAPREVVLTTMDAFDSLDDVTEFIASLREDGRLIEDPGLSNSQCASTKEMHNEYVQRVTLTGSAEDRRNRQGMKQFTARLEDPGLSNSKCASTKEMHNEYVQWVNLHGAAEDRRNRLGIKQFSARLEQMGWKKVRSNGTRWAGKALGMTTSV